MRLVHVQIFLILPVLAAGCAGTRSIRQAPPAAVEDIEHRIFLIGDAGDPAREGEPVLQALTRDLEAHSAPAVVVFLGDNIYPRGMPDSTSPRRPEMERRIDAQLHALDGTMARGIFIPGNHDWMGLGNEGWDAIREQQCYVDRTGAPYVSMLPKGGCPGPVIEDIGLRLRLVILDSEWWLYDGRKPSDPGAGCDHYSEQGVIDGLADALITAGDRNVFVAAHHPLLSSGPHGGHFNWRDHIFPLTRLSSWLWVPLPIVGSGYPLSRKLGISVQDQSSTANEHMRAAFEQVFADHPPLVYATGHEHTLEVLAGQTAKYLLVSGSGYYGHASPTARRDETLFCEAAAGYMRLDVQRGGAVRLAVVTVDDGGSVREAYARMLD